MVLLKSFCGRRSKSWGLFEKLFLIFHDSKLAQLSNISSRQRHINIFTSPGKEKNRFKEKNQERTIEDIKSIKKSRPWHEKVNSNNSKNTSISWNEKKFCSLRLKYFLSLGWLCGAVYVKKIQHKKTRHNSKGQKVFFFFDKLNSSEKKQSQKWFL